MKVDHPRGQSDPHVHSRFASVESQAGESDGPFTVVGRQNGCRDNELDLYLLDAGADGRPYQRAAGRQRRVPSDVRE